MQEILDRAQPWATTLILHNWPVLVYATIAVCAAIWSLVRPTRARVLVLYGAILLVLAFEYQKHGTATIVGTTTYLFSLEVNPGLRTTSQWFLLLIVPAIAQFVGFALLIWPCAWQLSLRLRRAHDDRVTST